MFLFKLIREIHEDYIYPWLSNFAKPMIVETESLWVVVENVLRLSRKEGDIDTARVPTRRMTSPGRDIYGSQWAVSYVMSALKSFFVFFLLDQKPCSLFSNPKILKNVVFHLLSVWVQLQI